MPSDQIERIQRLGTSILEQEVKTLATEEVFEGQSGTRILDDYRGVPVLSSYAPLDIEGITWAILAEIDVSEAFAPIDRFQRQVLISTAIIVLVVTLIALVLSNVFVRPIQILRQGFGQLSEGDTGVSVELNSKDEFQELAQSFNEMVDSLRQKTQLLQDKSRENEELLLSILPEPVAQRLKGGEESIADGFPNVTVLFADLVGFNLLANSISVDETVGFLNDLVSAFDEAVVRHGVEKVKTIGSSYMAVSGVSIPRLDHTKRIIDFGIEMGHIVKRFNQINQTDLQIRIGVNSGPVVAGIIGRRKFIYDVWGDTVNIAHCMQAEALSNMMQVSEAVYEQLGGFYEFEAGPAVELSSKGTLLTWVLNI